MKKKTIANICVEKDILRLIINLNNFSCAIKWGSLHNSTHFFVCRKEEIYDKWRIKKISRKKCKKV